MISIHDGLKKIEFAAVSCRNLGFRYWGVLQFASRQRPMNVRTIVHFQGKLRR